MAQSSLFSSSNQNYMIFPSSRENTDGLAGTVHPNLISRDFSLSGLTKPKPLLQSPLQASPSNTSTDASRKDFKFSDLYKKESLPHSPIGDPPSANPTMWEKFKERISNYGKDADGKYNVQASPLMRDLTAFGGLGLGVVSFLEDRKTTKLQREALRHDIDTAKEQRAKRQAMADSWSSAWDK